MFGSNVMRSPFFVGFPKVRPVLLEQMEIQHMRQLRVGSKMQRLPVEACTAILCFIAAPLDDLDEMAGAEGDVSSWKTCLCDEIVSKGVRLHEHPCFAQMQVSHPRQLLILAWKMT